MSKYNAYSDENLKKSKNSGDVANYNLIQGYKEDYKRAEAAGDTKGMEEAHKNAEAVRSAYGYTGGASGNAYTSIAPVKEQNNSFFGNAYEDINKMQKEGFNAYKGLVDAQKKGNIDAVNRGKSVINQNYKNAYDELMSQQEKTLDKLPEDMAKLGLYGSGTGETAYAKIKSGYAGELKKLLADKNNALADINGKIADLENQSAVQIAQYYADMMQKSPEMYLSMLNNQYGEKIDERNFKYQLERDKVADDRYTIQYNDSRGDIEYEKKLNNAKIAASYGNFQPLAELGLITPEMQKFNTNTYISANTPSSGSSKSGKSTISSADKEMLKSQVDTEISHWLYSPYNIDNTGYFYNGWNEDTIPQYAARDKINNGEVVRYIKNELISAGYTATQANNIIDGYKKTINEQIKKIEGKE